MGNGKSKNRAPSPEISSQSEAAPPPLVDTPPRKKQNVASYSEMEEAGGHMEHLVTEFKLKIEARKENCQRDLLFYLFLEDISKFVRISRYVKLLEE